MRGKFYGNILRIEVDTHEEKLDAGEGLQWLPCDLCGELQKVSLDLTSFVCTPCKAAKGASVYIEEEDEDEGNVFCRSEDSLESFLKDGGWESIEDFEEETGVARELLLRHWFCVVHGRVYIKPIPDL
jgi:hypothetical protein